MKIVVSEKKNMTKVKHSLITRLGEKSITNQGFETDMVPIRGKMTIEPIQRNIKKSIVPLFVA